MATLDEMVMRAAGKAGIRPNERIRFIVDYGNGIDPIAPCAAVMTFCENLLGEAAKMCERERVAAEETGAAGDIAYNLACEHCASAIRAII